MSPPCAVARWTSASLIFLAVIPPASANDASIVATPAGLVFEKNHNIAMMSEHLRISLAQIGVDYEFKNISGRPVTIKVGFPLPVFGMSPEIEGDFSFLILHSENFHVWINGTKISSKLDVRVYDSDGHDITNAFMASGLDPFQPPGHRTEVVEKLKKLNLWGESRTGESGAWWTAQKTYYWQQTFPPGKIVRISHRYRPWAGGFPQQTMIQFGHSIPTLDEYCIDRDFVDQFAKLTGFPIAQYTYGINEFDKRPGYIWTKQSQYGRWDDRLGMQQANVGYVLKTGADWAGPIRHFTLDVDKGDASLVSFCAPPGVTLTHKGAALIGTATNFVPTKDLDIYFMGPHVYPGNDAINQYGHLHDHRLWLTK